MKKIDFSELLTNFPGISAGNKYMITYILLGGIFFYFFSAILSSIFIVPVPQDKDWCRGTIEIEVSEGNFRTECVSFKSDFEKAKYYHNKGMAVRNIYIAIFLFLFALFITSMFFHFIPKWKDRDFEECDFEKLLSLATIAFIIYFIIPMIMGWFLPAPIKWFPQIFKDINNAQVESVLRSLR